MKKFLSILLFFIGLFLSTSVIGYSDELIGDISCKDISQSTRYPNLSSPLIKNIDIIGNKLNKKYVMQNDKYKEEVYNLYIKILNENIVKTKYNERQKEILLRIGDYFVCKKEELNNLSFIDKRLTGTILDKNKNEENVLVKNDRELGNGTTYYVDSMSGNDDNDGKSPEEAFKSIFKVGTISFKPGDNILFKRGETFKIDDKFFTIRNSGNTNNPITYGAYGDIKKDLPIITSVEDYKIDWVLDSGNIWKSKEEFSYNPQRLKRNNKEILRAQDIGELGTNVPSLVEWMYKDGYLYLYSLTDPNKDIFSYSKGYYTINALNVDNIIMQDLDIRGGYKIALSFGESDNLKLYGMKIGDFSMEGLRYKGGENLIIDSCVFDSNWPEDLDYTKIEGSGAKDITPRGNEEAIVFTGNALNSIIRNNIFKNWMHNSLSFYVKEYNGVKIFNNFFTAPDIAYGGKNSFTNKINNLEYYNNTHYKMYSGRTQHPGMTGDNIHYHHNLYKDLWISPLKDHPNYGFSITYNTDSKNVIIEDNLIINSLPGAIKVCGGEGKIIRRNIIINSSSEYGGAILICDTSYGVKKITIKDNNIYPDNSHAIFYKNKAFSIKNISKITPKDGDIISGNYSNSKYSLDGFGCDFIKIK